MAYKNLSVDLVEDLKFVNIIDDVPRANHVKEVLFVNMAYKHLSVDLVEDLKFVNMELGDIDAKHVIYRNIL